MPGAEAEGSRHQRPAVEQEAGLDLGPLRRIPHDHLDTQDVGSRSVAASAVVFHLFRPAGPVRPLNGAEEPTRCVADPAQAGAAVPAVDIGEFDGVATGGGGESRPGSRREQPRQFIEQCVALAGLPGKQRAGAAVQFLGEGEEDGEVVGGGRELTGQPAVTLGRGPGSVLAGQQGSERVGERVLGGGPAEVGGALPGWWFR
ncbi:hypothetical protein ADL22_26845 [Streptomyces sp. NRRL F-4489]|nr:hypothetical protein ADL22_26845 [Streptomyces sp. NRRL F-4489]